MRYGSILGIPTPISRIIQGTVMIRGAELERSAALLDAALAVGCNTFDTAHVYGGGESERLFGRWVRDRGVRDQIVVIDKGAHGDASGPRLSAAAITADLEESLARLDFQCIDLYLLHQDDPDAPVGPIVRCLNEHQARGHVGAFGASNWSHQRIEEANAFARESGLEPFVASSPAFSLATQIRAPWPGCLGIGGTGVEAQEARRWYAARGMPVLAWSSLAAGFFSGRHRQEDPDAAIRHHLDRLCIETYGSEENFRRLARARRLAAARGVSVAQIALAWVLAQPLDTFAIVGCTTPAHLAECAEALEIALDDDACAWLASGEDRDFPGGLPEDGEHVR